jgi:hypothetical protein
LSDPERRLTLGRSDFALLNPNTMTCPVFHSRAAAKTAKKLYRASPVLVKEGPPEVNPWDVRLFTMFHMTNDSRLFHTRDELEAEGFVLKGNRFVRGDDVCLPLYEAKMIHQFDHRFAQVVPRADSSKLRGLSELLTTSEHQDANVLPSTRYYVSEINMSDRSGEHGWFIGFRGITGAVANIRTTVFTVVPRAGFGNSLPVLSFAEDPGPRQLCGLLGNFNSFVLDFVTRHKISGMNLNFYILKQLPILPPDRYPPDLLDFIVPRVVELTYTAWDLQPFARDVLDEVGPETWARWFTDAPIHTSPSPEWAVEPTPAPFVWNEERRAVLRAELDGLYAHLYGLTRDELAYILDTFPIVRRKDEEKYGEYRTKRMVLEAFESLRPLIE